jgi:hypothetical protein
MLEFENQVQKVWPTLEEVLAKKEWNEDDVTVLVGNIEDLDAKTLAKLGVEKPEIK